MFPRTIRRAAALAVALALAAVAGGGAPQPLRAEPPKEKPDRPAQGAVVAKNTALRADVAYGKDEKQRLDVYSPKGAKGAPVVVFVHGGEWAWGDKAAVIYKPKLLNESGIVFVSVNYRLTPAVTHPAHASDVATALRWVHDHAEEVGGDPKKVVLMGHSAGCHLAALVGLDPRYLGEVKLKPSDVRGVVAWSGGAYDLVQKVNDDGAYVDYIRKAFGDSEGAWRDASPVAHVKGAEAGPAFLFVSIEAGNASHTAAERLAGLIRDAKGRADSKLIEGRDHFNANHLLGAPDDKTGKVLLDFVRKVTK
jgi:acetyl esterase/lipase